MADKQYHDHSLVQLILGEIVNQTTDCEFVKYANIDQMEDYPFFTFQWIDPGRETTADWLYQHRQYNCTMQVDCHSSSDTQAMDLMNQLYNKLHEQSYRRIFKQAHILPEVIGNAGNRTVLQGQNYDNDYGFDIQFTVTSGYSFAIKDLDLTPHEDVIESIKGNENVIGSNTGGVISVSKNKEEI